MESEPIIFATKSHTERKESEELKSDAQIPILDNWVESKTLLICIVAIFSHL